MDGFLTWGVVMAGAEFGLKLRNYRCFGDEWQGFERIAPINVIIGRNNSGKSSLLDLVEAVVMKTRYNEEDREHLFRKTLNDYMFVLHDVSKCINEDSYSNAAASSFKRGQQTRFPLEKRFLLYKNLEEVAVTWIPKGLNSPESLAYYKAIPEHYGNVHLALPYVENPVQRKFFRRMSSERDVLQESQNAKMELSKNGHGATNLIQEFINDNKLPHDLVFKSILNALNDIMLSDEKFTEITTQIQRPSNLWEIYLHSHSINKRIALSESGSGLKTILLVLINLFLIPHVEDIDAKDYYFGFEELENNLHPAVQRRLFSYLRDFAKEHGCHFFFTTHSPVVIDLFSDDENAQILHVTRDAEGKSIVRTVEGYLDNCHILDDLEARASDLLQANGIVWVEGPSDRIYFNRWVELWSDGELRDGEHYQCLSYGGSLGTYLSADTDFVDDSLQGFINILKVNRNAIFLADSDRESEEDELKPHIQRIQGELEGLKMLCWVTAGREVENYIPGEATTHVFNLSEPFQCEQWGKYFDAYVQAVNKKSYTKTKHAHEIIPALTKDMLENTLDLGVKLDDVCERICKWNGLEWPLKSVAHYAIEHRETVEA